MNKRKMHDGIVGVVLILGVLLAHYVDPAWLWLPLILGFTLLQSAFTGFCPVYFTLNKINPDKS